MIDILINVDDNYLVPAKVLIYSVLKHISGKNNVMFTVLCDQRLNDSSRSELKKEADGNLIFYDVDHDIFSGAMTEGHFSVTAYYRLLAPQIIKSERCIYLDCDMIVETDLSELYSMDLDDRFFVAGVSELLLIRNPNLALSVSEEHGITDFSDYINTGVMLMNLEKMRRENVFDTFKRELNKNNPWVDQDIINRVCRGSIKKIDWTWNKSVEFDEEKYIFHLGETSRPGKGRIVHWSGPIKPWKNKNVDNSDIWWKYAEETLSKNEYINLEINSIIDTESTLSKNFMLEGSIVIFGYSNWGIRMKELLLRNSDVDSIVFCDNNPKKRKLKLTEDIVYSLDELLVTHKNNTWINVVQDKQSDVTRMLIDSGIDKDRIREIHFV